MQIFKCVLTGKDVKTEAKPLCTFKNSKGLSFSVFELADGTLSIQALAVKK